MNDVKGSRLLYAVLVTVIVIFALLIVSFAQYGSGSIEGRTQGTAQVNSIINAMQNQQNRNTIAPQTSISQQIETDQTYTPSITPSEYSINPGDTVEVQGSGFSPKDTSCSLYSSYEDMTAYTSCTVSCCGPDGSATINAELGTNNIECYANGSIGTDITVTGYPMDDSATASGTNFNC